MPITQSGIKRPTNSGSEVFRGILEKTASPFVYQDQLNKRVADEVRVARGYANRYGMDADSLEKEYVEATKLAAGFAAKFVKTSLPEDDQGRAGAERNANNRRNEFQRCRSAAREWTAFADSLEAELEAFLAKLQAAQAQAALQTSSP